ncbi:hypothetical protein DPEC_G00121390 [Dallia pectoralis]|uniref:Uncharacterized protein n=1 Tax=Dallia pectoralis TaxID=75939 RepID=A0ACC2GQG8_DALPE|nr:hypothetical protein DPEC_G00121390 [Dallia pectoralis]
MLYRFFPPPLIHSQKKVQSCHWHCTPRLTKSAGLPGSDNSRPRLLYGLPLNTAVIQAQLQEQMVKLLKPSGGSSGPEYADDVPYAAVSALQSKYD